MFNEFNIWFYMEDNTCVKCCNYKFARVRELLYNCRVGYNFSFSMYSKVITIRIKSKYSHFDIIKDINCISDIDEVEKALLDYMGLEDFV